MIDAVDIPADAKVDRSPETQRIAREIEQRVWDQISKRPEAPKATATLCEEPVSKRIMADAEQHPPGTHARLRLVWQAAIEDRKWVNMHIRGMSEDDARRAAEDATRADFARAEW